MHGDSERSCLRPVALESNQVFGFEEIEQFIQTLQCGLEIAILQVNDCQQRGSGLTLLLVGVTVSLQTTLDLIQPAKFGSHLNQVECG